MNKFSDTIAAAAGGTAIVDSVLVTQCGTAIHDAVASIPVDNGKGFATVIGGVLAAAVAKAIVNGVSLLVTALFKRKKNRKAHETQDL